MTSPSPSFFDRLKSRHGSQSLGVMMAIFTGLCWAVLAVGLKVALKYSDPTTIAWFRLAAAFLFLAGFLVWRNPGELTILRRPPWIGVLAGIGIAVNYYGYMKGVALTSPSNAQIFIQAAPIMLILVGIFLFGEKPSPRQVMGFVLALLGFALFYRDQLASTVEFHERYLAGNSVIFIAAVGWTLFAALQKVLLKRGLTPNAINLLVNGVSALCLTPFVSWQVFATLSPGTWFLFILLALNTVVAYGALGIALNLIPASEVSVIITLNPLLTLAFMALLGAFEVTWVVPDVVNPQGWIAALVVVAGVALAVSRRLKRA